MKHIMANIRSISPYSQGRIVSSEKQTKETHEEHDARTWREKLHTDDRGEVFIPPMAFKCALAEAAKYLSIQIPGAGKATYTKHFEAGVLVPSPVALGLKAKEVESERLFVPASGKRGDGKRVWRTFPLIREWAGKVGFIVIDEVILQAHSDSDKTVFQHVLEQAGQIIGIGRFRPRNNGFYGRFTVTGMEVQEA